MELKLKEGVDLTKASTQHEVVLLAVQLLDNNNVHPITEIKLETIIACVGVVTDGEIISLIQDKTGIELFNIIKDVIEPFYYKEIYTNFKEEMKLIEETVIKYFDDLETRFNSVGRGINDLIALISNLTLDDKGYLKSMIKDLEENILFKKEQEKEVHIKNTQEEVSKKMKDLINKYATENNQ